MKKRLEQLKTNIAAHPISARQGLVLPVPRPGQLHRTADWAKNPDWFYLVTEVSEDNCEIIPGCFDAMMAGPGDIVLPPEVFGDYVFLSLDMAATLPREAVKIGFAELDVDTYNRVIDSQLEYETGAKGDMPSYPCALPYISRHDPRIAYHKKMSKLIQSEQTGLVIEETGSGLILPPLWPKLPEVLAAGDERGNIRKKCSIDTRQEVLSMVFSPTEKRAWIKILNADMSDFSTALDGAEVIDSREKVLGAISSGRCGFAVEADFDGSVAIRLADGSVCILTAMP